jgi:hypothetical protein
MTAGLPGAGIGGLFFILSAYFMLVLEIARTVRGRSSLTRWRFVLRNVGIATAMVAAVTATIWLVHGLLFSTSTDTTNAKSPHGTTDRLVPLAPVLIALAVLAVVLLTACLAQFVVRREPGPAHRLADRNDPEAPGQLDPRPEERLPPANSGARAIPPPVVLPSQR